jgi:hypothetical protein
MGDDITGHDRSDLASWAMLAAATLGSAWCAYQATLWSGEEMDYLAQSRMVEFASSKRTSIANRNMTIDAATYLQVAVAQQRGDTKVAAFLRQHARDELKPALEAWIKDMEAGRVDAPTPFLRPEYTVDDEMEATKLDDTAAAEIGRAMLYKNTNDVYVLHTVMFAMALFFLGATSQTRRRPVQRVMLAFGGIIFVVTTASMLRLPRARTTLPRELKKEVERDRPANAAERGRPAIDWTT